MRQRAEKLNAELNIISNPGKGTEIRFRGKIGKTPLLAN